MTHGKNRSKFRKIRIATCIIIIIIVLFIVCLKILFKKDTKNTENSKNEFTLYDSLIPPTALESISFSAPSILISRIGITTCSTEYPS